MNERRQADRNKTYLGGIVAFHHRYSTMNCIVRNFSTRGAKICFSNVASIPEEFDLAIAQKQKTYRARIVWRNADQAGITFIERETAAPVSLDLARQLRDAKAINATLRRRVAQLSSE